MTSTLTDHPHIDLIVPSGGSAAHLKTFQALSYERLAVEVQTGTRGHVATGFVDPGYAGEGATEARGLELRFDRRPLVVRRRHLELVEGSAAAAAPRDGKTLLRLGAAPPTAGEG